MVHHHDHLGQVEEVGTGGEQAHIPAVIWVGCTHIFWGLVGGDYPHGHGG